MFEQTEKKFCKDTADGYVRVAGEELTKTLINIGIFPNVNGYYMLKELTMMMLFCTDKQKMGSAYCSLSKRIGRSATSIERNVRFAITQAHNGGKLAKINSILGASVVEKNYSLTNSQLINLLAEIVHRKVNLSEYN